MPVDVQVIVGETTGRSGIVPFAWPDDTAMVAEGRRSRGTCSSATSGIEAAFKRWRPYAAIARSADGRTIAGRWFKPLAREAGFVVGRPAADRNVDVNVQGLLLLAIRTI